MSNSISAQSQRREYPERITIFQDGGDVTVSLTDQGCGDADILANQIFGSWSSPEYSANLAQIEKIRLDAESLPALIRDQLLAALTERFRRPVV